LINNRRDFLKAMGAGAAAGPLATSGFPSTGVATEFTNKTVRSATQKSVCASVRDLGLQFLDNRLRITGQDGATSTRLPDGDAFWMFGDTIEGPFETIRNHDLTEVLSNTASVVPAQDVMQGIRQFEYLKSADQKRPRQVIEFSADENKATQRLWPIHSICVHNTIYAFYHKITMDPQVDVFETFELNGMGIARARVGEYRFERLIAPDGTQEFWKGNQPGFGVFIEKLADGFLYLWGSYWTGMFLARTRAENIEDLTSYEYLVSAPTLAHPERVAVWQKTFQPSAVLFDGVPNELSVAYNSYLKQHIAIHVFHRENKLALRTAPSIVGPWSEPEIFFRPQRKSADDLFTAGKEHPELRRENGKVLYVTYVNSSDYVPRLLEITLA
jgi:hypothetical protein